MSVGGERILTPEADTGPGVHNQRWHETKKATCERLGPRSSSEDPRPEVPECSEDPGHVGELVEVNLQELTDQELADLAPFEEWIKHAGSSSTASEQGDVPKATRSSSTRR